MDISLNTELFSTSDTPTLLHWTWCSHSWTESTETKCLLTGNIAPFWDGINWSIWEKGSGMCRWAYFDLSSGGLLLPITVLTLHKFFQFYSSTLPTRGDFWLTDPYYQALCMCLPWGTISFIKVRPSTFLPI